MKHSFRILAILLLGSQAACGTFEVSFDPGLTATPPGNQPVASPVHPAATVTLPAVILPSATRIQFPPGATQSITEGSIQPGQSITLVLKALRGQVLMVSVDSPDQDVVLSILDADGANLRSGDGAASNSFIGTLPATQDYYFHLTGGASTESFTLQVIVAARIQFSAGEESSTLTGRTIDGLIVTYSAYAQKGQKLHVILDVLGDSAGLTVWGLNDGEPHVRAQSGVWDFSLVLPSTQDYIIQVVPQAGQVVDYTLTVQIE